MPTQNQFEYYAPQDLKNIKVNGVQPEDMTRSYSAEFVVDKKLKKALKKTNLKNDVFVLSTQFKKPKYKYEINQKILIDVEGIEDTAVCFGVTHNAIRGIRAINYFFVYEDL
ncbi:hypothetical protein [Serratia marcescens]|uniref:hypothetical protein n=1 Tax=Serratia marcescens TaxID=615 RepID=UPI0006699405|nr:hypothetical protein [Serratia marcescens]BEN87054.1 hypothetical protein SMQC07_08530 [Serratia marcescens]BEN92241.1 hypothetical protein SMQC08_08540 [Serratia marcescens]BEN97567.1 hypothetical protein SMQC11_08560 [Serratia marcescens]